MPGEDSVPAISGFAGGTAEMNIGTGVREAVLKTGALQAAILGSTHFSSIATDEKGIIQIFNVGAERMLGYAAADVMNRMTPADISDPQELAARARAVGDELGAPAATGFEAMVSRASRGIEDIYEWAYVRKDGSRFPAVVSVTALRGGRNEIIGYLLIGTASAIGDAMLEDARVAGANAARSEFLAHMSHELRTPLNIIIGFSEIIKNRMMGAYSEKYPEYAEDIYSSGMHLLSIVNNVLDLSKIEARRMVLKRTPQDICQIIRECGGMMSAGLREKKQDLILDLPPDLPRVSIDERAIKQAILNVLANASKYSREGGRVSIAASYGASQKAVCVEIRDNGVGITDEMQVLVFEPFYQSGNVMIREQGGMGLGLSISRRLVELHGGTLAMESVVGCGTTIRIALPADPPESVPARCPEA